MSRRRGPLQPVPEQHHRPPAVSVRSMRDLMERELPPVRWIVPGILPEGVTLLAGKAKVRKSWFALGLCTAVAAGGHALGRVRVERGEALYAALEDNERRLQSRGRKVLEGLAPGEAMPEGFWYATSWPRLDMGGTEALAGWLEEHPECRLVVLDTLAKVRPRSRHGSSGGYQEDYEALEGLLPLASERQVAIVVVTHTRKAAADDVLDEINATQGLMGGVDGFLIFRSERGKADATLYVEGRDIEEASKLDLRWDRELHGWMVVHDPRTDGPAVTQERRLILDYIRSCGVAQFADIVRAVGKSKQAVSNLLSQLEADRRIVRVGRGRYALADAEAEAGGAESTFSENPGVLSGVLSPPDTYRENPGKYTSTHRVHVNDDEVQVNNECTNVLSPETPHGNAENPPQKSTHSSTRRGFGRVLPDDDEDPLGEETRVW